MSTLKQFRSVSWAVWVMDPLALKFYSPLQNNFGNGLNFVTCEHSFMYDITVIAAHDRKWRLVSGFYLQAATTPSVPLSFQIQYVQLRTIMFQVHVQIERACASFKTSPPPAIATSLAMTTGEEIHKYGHVVEQVMFIFPNPWKRLLRMVRNLF